MDWKEEINFYNDYPSLKKVAYKKIAECVNESSFINILDYGCGDGKQISFLDESKNIHLYDINEKALTQAIENNSERKIKVYNSCMEIPSNTFNIVICSLVLMCIDNEDEFFETIKTFNRVLKNDSELILLITHPAFRMEEFSYYKTIFNKPFDYFKEGTPFKVLFKNLETDNIITDYHWSLSFTLNSLIKNGFNLIEFIEMKDCKSSLGFENKTHSPYLLLKFKS